MILGIDASNLRRGGGRTHLIEILNFGDPTKYRISKILVWGSMETLKEIEDKPWLTKLPVNLLSKRLIFRVFWQFWLLPRSAKKEKISLLFVPGGNFSLFFPYVTMSRNLLPFERKEFLRFIFNLEILRIILVRVINSISIKKAKGVIFLNEYAKNKVLSVTGILESQVKIIPHGINPIFFKTSDSLNKSLIAKQEKILKIIYVSSIDLYKHQWNVIYAVNNLVKRGFKLELLLVGFAYKRALKKFHTAIRETKPNSTWLNYIGQVSYKDLHQFYKISDIGIFASSCENMPNILLEKMASGLPIASSFFGPMRNILGSGGIYFNPEKIDEIEDSIKMLYLNENLRKRLGLKNYKTALNYSWSTCANKTFEFLSEINKKSQE